jgi:hypothetical protein
MNHHHGLPLFQQILILIFVPPIMSGLWWIASRGLGLTLQGGSVSDRTKNRQASEFWVLLIVLYLGLFAIFLYGWIRH